MDLDWLETFLAVVERGGFTAASARIHRSQSRVSAHIAALERELGVRLIDRSHRPATVTEAGRLFATHARQILDDVASARSAIGAISALVDLAATVRTTPGIGPAVLPGILRRLLDEHPHARVTVHEDTPPWDDPWRPADEISLAILPVAGNAPPSGGSRALWRERVRLLVPSDHDLATDRSPVTADRLAGYPMVLGLASGLPEPELLRLLFPHTAAPRARVTVDGARTLVAAVRAGLGVGVLNAVALVPIVAADLVVLDLAADDGAHPPEFEVTARWPDVLLDSLIGRALLDVVVSAPLPPGADAPAARE